MNKKIPKGFTTLGEKGTFINNNIIKEKKYYDDCTKILTIYNEIFKIKKEKKNV